MPSVYDYDAFNQRVNYATQCIIAGGTRTSTRHFDTCFEMNDGDAVVVALYRRSLNNPKLAANIWKALCQESVLRKAEAMKHISTQGLAVEARRLREDSQPTLPQVEPLSFPGSRPEPLPPFTLDGGSELLEVRHQGRLF
jgi:hypothetical protein